VAEIPLARFSGARWTVAMCDKDWREFCAVSAEANFRLTVVLERFCDHGEDNLPNGALRWMTPDSNRLPAAVTGAFEARGVVLHGRRAPSGSGETFFVTQIVVDPPAPPPAPPRRRNRDDRQGFLQLPAAGEQERR
jgi:hypothetical protein